MRGPGHPFWYFVLMTPYGASTGFLQVTVSYLAAQRGISATAIAQLNAISLLPHTWKFFWAPLADSTWSRKRWYWIANLVNALGIIALGAIPIAGATMGLLQLVALLGNVALTLVGMAVEGLMAENTVPETRGRAAGWFQAGNLGGAGIGGGAALWLCRRVPHLWIAASALAAVCLACGIALRYFADEEKKATAAEVIGSLRAVRSDLWQLLRSRAGLVGLLLSALPINTGAMANLWSKAADSWHASANLVAMVTGGLSGMICVPGCLLGGWLSDRMDRKLAYALAGVAMALTTTLMAAAPRSGSSYAWFVCLYALLTGVAWGTFTGFVLELIGHGAAATKYNIFASFSNMPLAYVTVLNGMAFDRWGGSGMLLAESVLGAAGISILLAVVLGQRLLGAPVSAADLASK